MLDFLRDLFGIKRYPNEMILKEIISRLKIKLKTTEELKEHYRKKYMDDAFITCKMEKEIEDLKQFIKEHLE